MRHVHSAAICAVSILAPAVLFSAAGLAPANVTVGRNLQAFAEVALNEAAPSSGLVITLASSDPSRVLLSTAPDRAGAGSIAVTVRAGFRASPEFYVQGLGESGLVTYTASAPGFGSASGTVTLAPSSIIFARSGMGLPGFLTTTGAGKSDISLHAALLDSSLNYVAQQPVAGGLSVNANVTSSNKTVGTITTSPVTITGGSFSATTQFQPLSPGDTTLTVSGTPGFRASAQFGTMAVTVRTPGIAVTDGVAIGQNLQIGSSVSLGEPAPAGGVVVTLTSSDPQRLLLSTTATDVGTGRITIAVPPRGVGGSFYLQALGNSGTVTCTASAPGYLSRVGTIMLTPSGVVLGGPQGPPDEAELTRDDAAKGPHGFVTSLSAGVTTPVNAYTVQLDPITRRGADLTVQSLRAGFSLGIALNNTHPEIGTVDLRLTIPSGSHHAVTQFKPLSVGVTEISVTTPAGFTKASNSTLLTVTVRQ